MAQPVPNSISDFVNRLITDEDFAREIKELVENVLQGRATVDVLRDRAAIEPAALRAMAPQQGENPYDQYKTTSVTTVTTASMTTLTTVTTVTATYILDVEADDPVE